MVGTLLFCALMVGFSQASNFWVAAGFLVLATIFVNISTTNNNTLALNLCEDSMRGRVSGVLGMSFGLSPLGVLPLAFFSEQFGVQQAVTIVSVSLGLLAVLVYVFSPTLRLMDKRARQNVKKLQRDA